MPTSFSGCSYLVLPPNYDFLTNRGTPQYYSLFNQIKSVAHIYIYIYISIRDRVNYSQWWSRCFRQPPTSLDMMSLQEISTIFDAQNTMLCNAHIILISPQSIQLPKHHSYFNWTLSLQAVSFPPALSEFLGKDMVSVPGRRRWEVQDDWRWPFLLCPRWNSPVEPQTGALKINFSGGNVNLEVSNWVFRVSLTSEVLVPI